MKIGGNLLIITLYVSSIRKFKRAVHEFNHKIPKEKAMMIYCYLLGLNIVLEIIILICGSENIVGSKYFKISFLALFNYTHLVLLYFIYKFLVEQRYLSGSILSNQISSIVFITNERHLIDAVKHELRNDELVRK